MKNYKKYKKAVLLQVNCTMLCMLLQILSSMDSAHKYIGLIETMTSDNLRTIGVII